MKYFFQISLIAMLAAIILDCSENQTSKSGGEMEDANNHGRELADPSKTPLITIEQAAQNDDKPKFVVIGNELAVASSVPQDWLEMQTEHVRGEIANGEFVINHTKPQFRMWGIIDESGKFLSWPGAPIALPYVETGVVPDGSGGRFSFGEGRVSF